MVTMSLGSRSGTCPLALREVVRMERGMAPSTESLSQPERTSSRRDIQQRLRGVRLLRNLDEELLQWLAARSSLHHIPKGGRFWMRGEPASHFNHVTRGVLELRRATASQEPTLVALFGPGECPAAPAALERARYMADAYATTELEVLRVPAEPILERLATDARLSANANRILLDHARLLHSKIDVLTAGPIPRRIALFLLDLAERFGDERDDGCLAIPLTLARRQVASYVDARVETVIRTFSAWRRDGLVRFEADATVIPSPVAFRAAINDDD